MPKTLVSEEDFRAAAKDGAAPVDASLRKGFVAEVKAADAATERALNFTISTASVDRMGDTIKVDGWKLDAYRKNPVVLWAHDSTMLPVGKAPNVEVSGAKLKAKAEFTPAGMAKFNDTVYDMYVGGFLSAVSVGFNPLKYAFTDDPQRRYGIDFLEQELLEFSAVPVPANADALIEGKSAGINVLPLLDWAEDQIKRAADTARIIKLAEDVLGSSGKDAQSLAWAERILKANGMASLPIERIERIERAAKQQRIHEKRLRDLDLIRARG